MSEKLTDAEIKSFQAELQELTPEIENSPTTNTIIKALNLICPMVGRLILEREQSAESDLLSACYMCLNTMERTGQRFHGAGTMKAAIAKYEANQ